MVTHKVTDSSKKDELREKKRRGKGARGEEDMEGKR